jgi:hypothetical protein
MIAALDSYAPSYDEWNAHALMAGQRTEWARFAEYHAGHSADVGARGKWIMTNAMVVYERMAELQTAANAMHASGYFGDVKSQAQAMVKVLAGAEIGLPPFASMSGIHIVNGKPTLGANLIATLVKNDPRYDYRVKRADNEACVLAWYEGGAAVGESSFSIQEANAAGLTGKQTWKAYASDMLFARALTRGARRYAPGIFGGAPIYTPDEMGVDTDEDGHIVQGEVINVTPPAANGKAQPATDSGPLPDDELTIEEAPAAKFIPDGCRPAGNGHRHTQGAAQGTRLWQHPRQARRTCSRLSQAARRHGRGR